MKKFVTPARPGLTMRMPDGNILPIAGMTVDYDNFWRRRVAEGSVLAAEPLTPGVDDPATWTTADGGLAPTDQPSTPTITDEQLEQMRRRPPVVKPIVTMSSE